MENQPPMGTPTGNSPKSVEGWLELYLVKKAPYTLPPNFKEFLAKISPWANIVCIVIALPMILLVLSLSFGLASFGFLGGYGYGYGYGYSSGWLWAILAGVEIVLLLISLPGLFKRSLKGWRFMFYANAIMIITSLLHVSVSGLIGDVIGLYFLFQIKELYRN